MLAVYLALALARKLLWFLCSCFRGGTGGIDMPDATRTPSLRSLYTISCSCGLRHGCKRGPDIYAVLRSSRSIGTQVLKLSAALEQYLRLLRGPSQHGS